MGYAGARKQCSNKEQGSDKEQGSPYREPQPSSGRAGASPRTRTAPFLPGSHCDSLLEINSTVSQFSSDAVGSGPQVGPAHPASH